MVVAGVLPLKTCLHGFSIVQTIQSWPCWQVESAISEGRGEEGAREGDQGTIQTCDCHRRLGSALVQWGSCSLVTESHAAQTHSDNGRVVLHVPNTL